MCKKMRVRPENTVHAGNKTWEWIDRLLDEGYTWREIGAEIGLSHPLLWRFYHRGWEPKDNDKRRKLELPLLCPRCGMEIT